MQKGGGWKRSPLPPAPMPRENEAREALGTIGAAGFLDDAKENRLQGLRALLQTRPLAWGG